MLHCTDIKKYNDELKEATANYRQLLTQRLRNMFLHFLRYDSFTVTILNTKILYFQMKLTAQSKNIAYTPYYRLSRLQMSSGTQIINKLNEI